jgi:hypothetical protein
MQHKSKKAREPPPSMDGWKGNNVLMIIIDSYISK